MLEEIDERAAEELLRGESCADCLAAYDCAAFLFDNSKVFTLSPNPVGRDTLYNRFSEPSCILQVCSVGGQTGMCNTC